MGANTASMFPYPSTYPGIYYSNFQQQSCSPCSQAQYSPFQYNSTSQPLALPAPGSKLTL